MDGDTDRNGDWDKDRDTNMDGDTERNRDISRVIRPQRTNFEFEYLCEFETEFKNNLDESGVYMGLIHKKNRGRISCATAF